LAACLTLLLALPFSFSHNNEDFMTIFAGLSFLEKRIMCVHSLGPCEKYDSSVVPMMEMGTPNLREGQAEFLY
jgi:hypothetical protein